MDKERTNVRIFNDAVANLTEVEAPMFPYKVGQWVYPDEWDDNRFNECSHGIHFFMNAQEAVDY